MKSIIDIISKYQPYFLGLAIFLSLLAVSFTSIEGQVELTFQSYPIIMLLLVAISIMLVLIYIAIDKHRIGDLSSHIREVSREEDEFNSQLLDLTSRQKEVYDLILSGNTNKEIMGKLYIEQSTLKSHINQIYKKLKIQSRKELRSKVKL